MTDAEQQRLTDLKAKLTARIGKPGFEANCRAIQAEIERMQNEDA